MATIGYSAKEMTQLAQFFKYQDYCDQHLKGISDSYGLETGRKLTRLLERLIKYKTGKKGLTFAEHWKITGRQLWINAAYLEMQECQYYSVITTPDMLVTDAIRRSISIPFLFTAVKTEQGTFVDGACYDSLPCFMFPIDSTVCINIINQRFGSTSSKQDSFIDYSIMLLGGIFNKLNSFIISGKSHYKIINIETDLKSLRISLDKKELKSIIKKGYSCIKSHLDTFT
jgi:predicted patatin/cPLA2 family phospholipase